jgi:hypothetical protein
VPLAPSAPGTRSAPGEFLSIYSPFNLFSNPLVRSGCSAQPGGPSLFYWGRGGLGQGGDRTPLFFHLSNCFRGDLFSEGGALGPARPIRARTPRVAWFSYTSCDSPRKQLEASPSAGTRFPQVAGATLPSPARLPGGVPAQKLQASAASVSLRASGPYASYSRTFPSFGRRLRRRALPVWSPGGFLGACRSCGQKLAHHDVLASAARIKREVACRLGSSIIKTASYPLLWVPQSTQNKSTIPKKQISN